MRPVARGLGAAAALALALGCVEPAPLALRVEPLGCRALLAGPTCEVSPTDALRLHVEVAEPAQLSVSFDDGAALERAVTRRAVLELSVPEDATILTLTGRAPSSGRSARWTMKLAPDVRAPAIRRAEALRADGRDRDAEALLASTILALDSADKARALGLRGRIALRKGDLASADDLLRASAWLHAHLERDSDATDDGFARAWLLTRLTGRNDEARRLLDSLKPRALTYPEGAARWPYYRALVALQTGDLRAAVRLLTAAVERAEALELSPLARNARVELGRALQLLGRDEEADRWLSGEPALEGAPPCERGDAWVNRGWLALLRVELGAGEPEAARAALDRAGDAYQSGCADPQRRANLEVNLALTAAHRGLPALARAHLSQAARHVALPAGELAAWWLEADARVALLEGRAATALEVYRRATALAVASGDLESQWRATLGRARALRAHGREEQASAAFAEADDLLEAPQLALPITFGQGSFLRARAHGTSEHLELLTDLGRAGEALNVVRRARRRVLRRLSTDERLGGLDERARGRWEAAIATYQSARSDLRDAAARDWELSSAELVQSLMGRRELHLRLRDALEDAMDALAGAPAPVELPPLPPRTAVLAVHPRAGGWLLLCARDGAVALARGPSGDLSPVQGCLDGAAEIELWPHGALRHIDFHALPYKGQPLVAHAPVAYGLDLGPSRPEGTRRGVLVVGDPRGDLPRAIAEARDVAARAPEPATLWLGAEATFERVVAALPNARRFHFAGHGIYRGDEGWHSALPLAAGAELSIADILTLGAAPSTVILSGCDTAKGPALGSTEGLGLAAAFLLAGAQSVTATSRPVSDELASAMGRRLASIGADERPASALRRAALALRAEDPERDWSAFRVLVR